MTSLFGQLRRLVADPDAENHDIDRVFSGSWEAFEAWIRQAIGGDFLWKTRPRDTPEQRQLIIDVIRKDLGREIFAGANLLLQRADSAP